MPEDDSLMDEHQLVDVVEYPDYFAELYVAGLMAAAGWNVYFPHRDRGLDFIACKTGPDRHQIIRPVQVKGKYPLQDKGDQGVYGFVGPLNQIHPQLVLAIPFFAKAAASPPLFVAYMPYHTIKSHKRGYRCQPACFTAGQPSPRRDFAKYIDSDGLGLVEQDDWGTKRAI